MPEFDDRTVDIAKKISGLLPIIGAALRPICARLIAENVADSDKTLPIAIATYGLLLAGGYDAAAELRIASTSAAANTLARLIMASVRENLEGPQPPNSPG